MPGIVHRVVVLAECEGNDIIFRIVRLGDVSQQFRLKDKQPFFGGNPYALYGDHVERWMQTDKQKLLILVATFSSGSLTDFRLS